MERTFREIGTYHSQTTGEVRRLIGVYFSVADPDLGRYSRRAQFDHSLLSNALFQPGLLIPDTWFYMSHHIERHLLSSGRGESLIEAMIRGGVIIPSFRNPEHIAYNEDAFESAALEAKRLYGKTYDGEATAFSERFREAFYGNKVVWHVWPDASVGVGFQELLDANLRNPKRPPHINAIADPERRRKLLEYWDRTETWRTKIIDKAQENLRDEPGAGIRRIDVWRGLHENLGGVPGQKITSIADLLPNVPPQDRVAFALFLRWFSETYQYNQAKMFDAIPNFTEYTSFGGLVPWSALSPTPAAFQPQIKLNQYPTITHEVKLPPFHILLSIPANNLVEIRTTSGQDYFQALSEWYESFDRSGSESAESRVKSELDLYSKRIVQEVTKMHSSSDMWTLRAIFSPSSPTLAGLKVGLATLGASGVTAGVGHITGQSGTPLLVLGAAASAGAAATGTAIYNFIGARSRRGHAVHVRGPVELNVLPE